MPDYQALFEPDRKHGGYVVTFPDLGHGATQGETFDEAREMAQDLLRAILGELMKRGDALPAPKKRRGQNLQAIGLPALQSAKTDLYGAFLKSGIKKTEFARRIGIPKTSIDRLFDLDHASRFDQIEAAFAALGKRIEFKICDAA
jgi:antitoxin HicB